MPMDHGVENTTEAQQLRRAYEVRTQQLEEERAALIEERTARTKKVSALEQELYEEREQTRYEVRLMRDEIAELTQELHAVQRSRSWRYTEIARAARRKLRRWLTLGRRK